MVLSRALRCLLVAALIGILVLAGFGRGVALADGPATAGVPGVGAPICHGGSDPRSSGDPTSHACCDTCLLLAPAVLVPPIAVAAPASTARAGRVVEPDAVRPRMGRPRSPRQAQGPPVVPA